MPSFHNGDVEIAYLDEGEGDPIVLVHGFASSKTVNWVYPTWVSELRKHGYRVVALDNRGHGNSEKLYDPESYHVGIMAGDITALMDHLKIERADIMGYSLGGRMTAWLAHRVPQRLRSAILGGIAMGLIEGGGPGENVAKALEVELARRRDGPDRAHLPRVRRSDPFRPQGACGLPARLAPFDDARGSRRHQRAGIDRGRHRRRDRRLDVRTRQDHSRFKGTRHPEPRSHARGRRQGL